MTDFEILNFFQGLSFKCSKVSRRAFSKGELITSYSEKKMQMYVLLRGSANLIRYDFNGNKTIINHFVVGDLFGQALYPSNTNSELFVEAKMDCEALCFFYDSVLNKCDPKCKFHGEFERNLSFLIMAHTVNLNERIEILTKKNIRDKLLAYFQGISAKTLSSTFDLPFSLTDLADYLSVDRSAMMREISRLKDLGIIEKNGRRITLI